MQHVELRNIFRWEPFIELGLRPTVPELPRPGTRGYPTLLFSALLEPEISLTVVCSRRQHGCALTTRQVDNISPTVCPPGYHPLFISPSDAVEVRWLGVRLPLEDWLSPRRVELGPGLLRETWASHSEHFLTPFNLPPGFIRGPAFPMPIPGNSPLLQLKLTAVCIISHILGYVWRTIGGPCWLFRLKSSPVQVEGNHGLPKICTE